MLKGKELVVDVKPRWRRPRCPECGELGTIHETREPRFWRDLAFGETVTLLRYAARRVACEDCGVHVESVPWAAPKSRFTRRMEELVAYLAQQMSKTAVCKLAGIDWRTVGTVVERIIGEKLDPTRLDDLTVIGVDELSFRRHHPGMRWGRDRSERVLLLRCILLSGLWDDFAAHVVRAPSLKLRASPMPARPYEAAPRKEAA